MDPLKPVKEQPSEETVPAPFIVLAQPFSEGLKVGKSMSICGAFTRPQDAFTSARGAKSDGYRAKIMLEVEVVKIENAGGDVSYAVYLPEGAETASEARKPITFK